MNRIQFWSLFFIHLLKMEIHFSQVTDLEKEKNGLYMKQLKMDKIFVNIFHFLNHLELFKIKVLWSNISLRKTLKSLIPGE